MNDSTETLQGAYSKLEDQIKIKVNSPMFLMKLALKVAMKKINPFSVLMQGKGSKAQTNQYMTNASSTGDYTVTRGYSSDSPHPYAPEGDFRRGGPNMFNLGRSPLPVKFDPNQLNQ
jgi:hypothetical protein